MIISLFEAPRGMVAIYGDPNNADDQIERDVVKIALHDSGEISPIVWDEKSGRFCDAYDPIMFKDFINLVTSEPDEEEDSDEPEPEGEPNEDLR